MRVQVLAVLLLGGACLACFVAPVTPFLDEIGQAPAGPEARPRWPAPPAKARIRYLGAVSSERQLDPRGSLWRRLAAVLTGAGERGFVRPAALCVRGDTLAVADPGASRVHLLDLARRRWRVLARAGDGWLRAPVGVACLPDGRILVSDSVREGIFAYGPGGEPLGRFAVAELRRPTGLAFDSFHSRLWVVETLEHRLRAFGLDGIELLRVGQRGSAPGSFNYPTLVAVDPEGGLWVTDALNFRLQHVSGSGRLLTHFGTPGNRAGEFARPRGLAVDAAGRVFAVDALLDAVQIFSAQGELLLVFGGRGGGPGQFWLPADVALDSRGHVYVADSYNRRVQVFAYRPPEAGP